MRKKITIKKGFTLVEIMVAVSIFVIVAFIVTSTLLAILDASRRANKIRLIIDNTNFALDSMTTKLKFGTDYSISNSNTEIRFTDRDGHNISYCSDVQTGVVVNKGTPPKSNNTIIKCDFLSGTGFCKSDVPGCSRIITPEISITSLLFKENDCTNNSFLGECNKQIIISVKATAQVKPTDVPTKLDFQTSVSNSQSSVSNKF